MKRWLLLLMLLLTACESSAPDPTLRFNGSTMGTSYDVKLVLEPTQSLPSDFPARVEALLQRVNRIMSTYDAQSELSRFNRNPSSDWIAVSPELQNIVAEALRFSELSNGAFDITVGPLVNLWGFGPAARREQAPSAAEIAQARQRVGYWQLQSREQPPALKKQRADLYVDLSGIAKGYGVDQLALLVESLGINNYLVAIGGEIRAKGKNGRGQVWTVAIEKPVAGQRAVERLVRLENASIATSGDYRNFFEVGGKRYAHIINPQTGQPLAQTLVSATVISNQSMLADAAATTLMVAGAEGGVQLASAHQLAAFFIIAQADGSFAERSTPEFAPYLLPQQP